jgi:hypothetical protein
MCLYLPSNLSAEKIFLLAVTVVFRTRDQELLMGSLVLMNLPCMTKMVRVFLTTLSGNSCQVLYVKYELFLHQRILCQLGSYMEGEITSSKSREALVQGSDKSCNVCQFGYTHVSFWTLP